MPDWILNSKILTIIASVLCVAVIIAFVLGYVGESIMLTILGFAGFSGVAALRDWIDSQGWKTYLMAGMGILGTIAMTLGWITPDVFIALLTLFGMGAAGTTIAAVKKVPAGTPVLKSMKIAA